MQEIQIIKKINHFKKHYTEQTKRMRATCAKFTHVERESESEILKVNNVLTR